MIHPVEKFIAGIPKFDIDLVDILAECKEGGALKVFTPLEYHTERQRAWYRGVAIPWLVKHDENKESVAWWDMEVKRECNGLKLLKKEIFMTLDGVLVGRLTIKEVGKKNMTAFIDEILAKSVEKNWGIAAPDPELRSKK